MYLFPHQQQHQHQMAELNVYEEKMTVLKKVYADILLNTTKESAARILVSESKARHYHQSLLSTKEEAVQTLVRLKGIMDAKASEAEIISSSQLKRIQELESQLSESECTIRKLKEELKNLNNELQKGKEKPPEESEKHSGDDATSCEAPCQENGMVIPDSMPSSSGSDNGCNTISKNCMQTDISEQLISSMMVHKEPGSCRSGCTQRIHAAEQKFSTFGLSDAKLYEMPSVCTNLDENLCSIKCESTLDSYETPNKPNGMRKNRKCGSGQTVRFSRRLSEKDCRSKYAARRNSTSTEPESSGLLTQGSVQKVLCSEYLSQVEKCENEEKLVFSPGNCERSVENSECKPVSVAVNLRSAPESSEINGTSSCTIGTRVVKYTFQRKRLKRPASIDENACIDSKEISKKQQVEFEVSASVDPKNASLILESPCEGRQIAQVACQSICLSEKGCANGVSSLHP